MICDIGKQGQINTLENTYRSNKAMHVHLPQFFLNIASQVKNIVHNEVRSYIKKDIFFMTDAKKNVLLCRVIASTLKHASRTIWK